jgi:hypothetical protein
VFRGKASGRVNSDCRLLYPLCRSGISCSRSNGQELNIENVVLFSWRNAILIKFEFVHQSICLAAGGQVGVNLPVYPLKVQLMHIFYLQSSCNCRKCIMAALVSHSSIRKRNVLD